ncbi:MAG: NADPH dehydrogenase NamA [Eubacteriales bacterium]|nr:NADPH dehydrogenase NamA [Eubacteriales bacterium]MDD4323614.1 NADPH dehydrogenase NamA [Eubacteriales bacterium]
MRIFEPFKVKNLELKNRIVMPPMCLFTARDGLVNDRHFVHYTSRALGGTALIIMEATAIMPNGRITDDCLGIWDDSYIDGLKRVVDSCHDEGALMALQLNHAGRKSEAEGEKENYTISPSPLASDAEYRTPREMTAEDMREVKQAFCDAAIRADAAGFDAIEIHGAHGYLLSTFLSPVSNQRRDEYGGSLENRARFLLEVLEAVRGVWPEEKALLLRLSATDYLAGGTNLEETVQVVNMAKKFVDLFHISSGGIAEAEIDVYPGYQIPLAETIRKECDVPVIAVGLIREREMVEEILANGRADLVALGRELLRNPYWVANNAWEADEPYEYADIYKRGFGRKF